MHEPPKPKKLKSTGKTIPVSPISAEKLLWNLNEARIIIHIFPVTDNICILQTATFGDYMKAIIDINHTVIYVYCMQ